MTVEVDVLGTKYSIIKSNKADDVKLERFSGYCDTSVNQIVIDTFKADDLSVADLGKYEKEVLRHELVHAFLSESGLADCSWGGNEEIVDWISLMFPKMLKVFQELDVI